MIEPCLEDIRKLLEVWDKEVWLNISLKFSDSALLYVKRFTSELIDYPCFKKNVEIHVINNLTDVDC